MLTKRNVSNAAWAEYKQARASQGGCSEEMLGCARAPGGFVAIELGFGFGEGPSILATLQRVDDAHERRRVALGDGRAIVERDLEKASAGMKDAGFYVEPPRPKAKRESATDRKRRLDTMLRHHQRKASPMSLPAKKAKPLRDRAGHLITTAPARAA